MAQIKSIVKPAYAHSLIRLGHRGITIANIPNTLKHVINTGK